MRQIPGRPLWLGNAGDLRDPRALFDCNIAAVVELADNEPFAPLSREFVRCRIPLSDGGDNPTWLLRLAAESVATLLRARVPVLVCCSAGMSRSVSVAAAALSLAETRPLAEALDMVVGSGPLDVLPGLLLQFKHVLNGPDANNE